MYEEILFNELRIWIPDDFVHMSESMVDCLYPFAERPQILYTNEEKNQYYTFRLTEKSLLADKVMPAAREIRKMIGSLAPASLLSQAMAQSINGLASGSFSFRTDSINESQIHTFYIISLKNQMLLCVTTCPLNDKEGSARLCRLVHQMERISSEEQK